MAVIHLTLTATTVQSADLRSQPAGIAAIVLLRDVTRNRPC